MMFLGAGRVLYLQILAAFSSMGKSRPLGSSQSLDLKQQTANSALRSTGICRRATHKILELVEYNFESRRKDCDRYLAATSLLRISVNYPVDAFLWVLNYACAKTNDLVPMTVGE